ncbi:MAG: amidohydrolase, partial [Planctomycetota bacterium]|nr:amidohydrolase [Planctomycetota bacterium]
LEAQPPQRELWLTNATIWTSGPDGTFEGWMHVVDGKIESLGKGDLPAGARRGGETIDLEGAHITPGLIDCHSHTGISGGVNEGTEAVTSEVRIFDVIDPDDINFYRQLAGGLTAANQLHGSANPIGGQNSVVKLRWGAKHPDDMRLDSAAPGIKFALGENVKQVHWGERFTSRYPKSRMGVEAIIRDRFTAARDYSEQWEAWNGMSSSDREKAMPPRRDLELEALAEILDGERLVHCHSYRQDEILMLCRVAEEFDFTIGTFQHVLEGYKVAEAIRDNALGGSSFSDWWAFKFEVYDAIPHNGAIMHEVGVTVSFNSDSDELARRMNAEAAKAVKYGGVSPEEALKFVTLNPAKQLRIDDRVGSLEPGKDADFVIWSGDPLSTLSRCEATYIDGREYFSRTRDAELRKAADAERRRIAQKILSKDAPKKKPGGEMAGEGADAPDATPTAAAPSLIQRVHLDAIREQYLDMLRAGIDPNTSKCGQCGCEGAAFMVLR